MKTGGKQFNDPGDPGVPNPLPTNAAIRVSDNERRRAQLYVCGMQAADPDDARFLLAVLGIDR